jgi:hypothetical protein
MPNAGEQVPLTLNVAGGMGVACIAGTNAWNPSKAASLVCCRPRQTREVPVDACVVASFLACAWRILAIFHMQRMGPHPADVPIRPQGVRTQGTVDPVPCLGRSHTCLDLPCICFSFPVPGALASPSTASILTIRLSFPLSLKGLIGSHSFSHLTDRLLQRSHCLPLPADTARDPLVW